MELLLCNSPNRRILQLSNQHFYATTKGLLPFRVLSVRRNYWHRNRRSFVYCNETNRFSVQTAILLIYVVEITKIIQKFVPFLQNP